MKNPAFKKALDTHRWLFAVIGISCLITAAQSVYLGVTWGDFIDYLQPIFIIAYFKFLVTMLVFGAIAFARRGFSWWPFERTANKYLNSETFFFGFIGGLVIVSASIIFIIQKCYIPYFNPFGHWDPIFAKIDHALHFDHYPHEYLVPIATKYPIFAQLLDDSYYVWYAFVSVTAIYCLYGDRNFRRRMQYMWVYVIAFLFVGGGLALIFSSVGPIFYGDFIPAPSPYQGLADHLTQMDARVGLHFVKQRHWLLEWVRNNSILDLNSIAAMPSMHNATTLFSALYLRTVNRYAFGVACVLAVLVFIGSIYTGLHYAIDAYAGYAVVGIIWWLAGRLVQRLYPGTEDTVLTI